MDQINVTCEGKEEWIKKYLGKVKQCIKGFTTTQFQQIPREDNMETNVQAKTASVDEIMSDQIKIQYIPSIDILEVQPVLGCHPQLDHIQGKPQQNDRMHEHDPSLRITGSAKKNLSMDDQIVLGKFYKKFSKGST